MQIKTTLRFHVSPIKIVIIKKQQQKKAGKDSEEKELLYTVGRKIN
jgi:hypothetical protein